MSDGRYLVVLPGVTDLSSPDLGLSGTHRSVRDLDRHAYPSSRSSSVADNRYAQMVAEALTVRAVPFGSEVVIVGHSFGADTALDLAADPNFNGADHYRVTHVVAAAYHSEPQLEHMPAGTEVLVLQNSHDLVVIAEAVADAHVADAIESRKDLLIDVVTFDLPGIVANGGRTIAHDLGVAAATVDHTLDRADEIVDGAVEIAVGIATHDPRRAIDGVTDGATALVTLEPGISTPRPGHVVAVFDGGGAGAGHHVDHYTAYLDGTTAPEVLAFLASLGSVSTATVGTAYGIDVSVPARRRPR